MTVAVRRARAVDTTPAPAWSKSCGCGREFSEHEWSMLPFVGIMTYGVESIEMRNCPGCSSTMAIEVNRP